MDTNLTSWGDFLVLGVFLFFLGIGCTFGRCYREYSRDCELACRNHIMDAIFVRSTVGSAATLLFAGLVVLTEALRTSPSSGPAGSVGSGGPGPRHRWNVWLAWLPVMVYALCRVARDRCGAWWPWGGLASAASRLCLAAAFAGQFLAVRGHLVALPAGADRSMYEPQCLVAALTVGLVLADALGLVPADWRQRARWLRCACTMVQGTWLVQIGCTLCVSGREWDRADRISPTVALVFLWHCALAALVVHFVRRTVRSALCTEAEAEEDPDADAAYYDIVYADEDEMTDPKDRPQTILLQN